MIHHIVVKHVHTIGENYITVKAIQFKQEQTGQNQLVIPKMDV